MVVQEAREVDNSGLSDEYEKIDWSKNVDITIDAKEIKVIRETRVIKEMMVKKSWK